MIALSQIFFNIHPVIRKTAGLTVLALFSASVISGANRNLLTTSYSKEEVVRLIARDDSWVGYPSYRNREAWERIPEAQKRETIKAAEEYLGYKWPLVSATMYLEFTRSGNRVDVERVLYGRLEVLRKLALAELMEGEKRFLDDLINGVFSLCEQTYWGMPSTFYMYRSGFRDLNKPNTVLPDIDDPIIDLYVADTAGELAWIWYFFHQEFDQVSPVISERLKSELQKKVLIPFYERTDFWWLTGWGKGDVNNWTPWCNYNMLTCIALIEDDPLRKAESVYKTMASVDLFINAYPEDGSCEEGPNYWSVAGGKLFDYLMLLNQITQGKINLFQREVIQNIGRYLYRIYICPAGTKGQYYANYSDSPPIVRQDGGSVYRYGRMIDDPALASFGISLLKEIKFKEEAISGRIGEALENLFNMEGWQTYPNAEPLLREFYFPDGEMAIARDKGDDREGFCFFAKGGNNGVSHNHNDVGSCILFFNGVPVLIDVGVGTYTAKTFSNQRYTIWTMQSEYHNLPFINGYGQYAGSSGKAQNSRFVSSGKSVSFSTDISRAYPREAKVGKWIRSYTLHRGKRFIIQDFYALEEIKGNTAIHFMTSLPCHVVNPGVLEFRGDRFTLKAKFDPAVLGVQIEPIEIEDPVLLQTWGNNLYRIILTVKHKKKSGTIIVEIS